MNLRASVSLCETWVHYVPSTITNVTTYPLLSCGTKDTLRVWEQDNRTDMATYPFRPSGTGDAKEVLGDITLRFIGKAITKKDCTYTVQGVLRSFDDNYGFEMHEGRPLRNAKTRFAAWLHGDGTPYDIQIRGKKKVSESGKLGRLWNAYN